MSVIHKDVAEALAIGDHQIEMVVSVEIAEHDIPGVPGRLAPGTRKHKSSMALVPIYLFIVRVVIADDNIQIPIAV